jgi:hypothetical protein
MPQDSFFKKLPSLLPSIPMLVAQRKLLPMLASAIEYGGAPPVSPSLIFEIPNRCCGHQNTWRLVNRQECGISSGGNGLVSSYWVGYILCLL